MCYGSIIVNLFLYGVPLSRINFAAVNGNAMQIFERDT